MFVIGITGGTGAGKTTALEAVKALGGAVIDCDAVYHRLLETSGDMLEELEQAFPGVVAEGVLDRKALGRRVFQDEGELQKLNGITHRYVDREVQRLLRAAAEEGLPLAAIDAIALIESGLGERCHITAAVTAPEDVRIQRLMAREGISEEYARLRIRAQKDEAWFRAHCGLTLENSGSKEDFARLCENRFSELLRRHQAGAKEGR